MSLSMLDVFSLVAMLLMIVGMGLYLYARSSAHARVSQRLNAGNGVQGAGKGGGASTGFRSMLGRGLQSMGKTIPLFDAVQRSEMERKLVSAGYRQPNALPILMGLAAGSAIFTAMLTATVAWPYLGDSSLVIRALCLLVGAYLGLLLPRIVVDRLVRYRQKAIELSFPDALDLLVVCTNSGLGLNAALQRVAGELEYMAPELADELSLTASELQLSGDAADVLHKLAERIGLPSVRGLVSTLIQSRQFGTPIGQSLRVLSRSERTARLMRTEEAAAKLATKITLPMMLFILPTVMIVAAGPAVLRLMQSFGNM